jgi:hypothetical protein
LGDGALEEALEADGALDAAIFLKASSCCLAPLMDSSAFCRSLSLPLLSMRRWTSSLLSWTLRFFVFWGDSGDECTKGTCCFSLVGEEQVGGSLDVVVAGCFASLSLDNLGSPAVGSSLGRFLDCLKYDEIEGCIWGVHNFNLIY